MSSNGDSEGKRSDLFPEKREGRCCSWGRESAPLKSSVVLPLKGNLPTGKEEIKKISGERHAGHGQSPVLNCPGDHTLPPTWLVSLSDPLTSATVATCPLMVYKSRVASVLLRAIVMA